MRISFGTNNCTYFSFFLGVVQEQTGEVQEAIATCC